MVNIFGYNLEKLFVTLSEYPFGVGIFFFKRFYLVIWNDLKNLPGGLPGLNFIV